MPMINCRVEKKKTDEKDIANYKLPQEINI